MIDRHHDALVIGGGNAGISLAARLLRKSKIDVAIIEPKSVHHFQPLFSHVAPGAARMKKAARPQASVMPGAAHWIQDRVVDIRPQENIVTLADGRRISYDQLVVAPGLQLDFDAVPGLSGAMDGVYGTSDYDPSMVTRTMRN